MEAESARLDLDPRGIETCVRSSVHYYNDENDLDRLVDGVRRSRGA
jgi:selenocysteine lyase/cysteine desulfurase